MTRLARSRTRLVKARARSLTIVKKIVTRHESFLKLCPFIVQLLGYKAYNRFMEGTKGFQGCKAQFLV